MFSPILHPSHDTRRELLTIRSTLVTNYLLQLSRIAPGLLHATHLSSTSGLELRTTRHGLRSLLLLLQGSALNQFTALSEIAATDRLTVRGRFAVKYILLSQPFNQRLSVELFANETLTVPSVTQVVIKGRACFASAGWLEREVWDLFGLYFNQNQDLRRILTDYGFTGHPLRKDFPLTGFYELAYNDAEGRVVYEPVELAQEFRVFHL